MGALILSLVIVGLSSLVASRNSFVPAAPGPIVQALFLVAALFATGIVCLMHAIYFVRLDISRRRDSRDDTLRSTVIVNSLGLLTLNSAQLLFALFGPDI